MGETLTFSERKRYAKANRVLRLGLYSHDINKVLGIELTTKGKNRNSWKKLKQDNRELRRQLKVMGYKIEERVSI